MPEHFGLLVSKKLPLLVFVSRPTFTGVCQMFVPLMCLLQLSLLLHLWLILLMEKRLTTAVIYGLATMVGLNAFVMITISPINAAGFGLA